MSAASSSFLPEALLVYLDKVFLHHKRIRLNDKVRIKNVAAKQPSEASHVAGAGHSVLSGAFVEIGFRFRAGQKPPDVLAVVISRSTDTAQQNRR